MAPTGRPDGLGLHPPAGGGRSVLLSGTDFAGTGDAVPHPRLVRLRLSARSHGGGNRLVAARVKQRFSGNNSALPLIHQVFAVIVASASCHAPS